ncbi:MAG: radical SAM protein, partial [Bacteroidota bacterium]
EMSLEVHPNYTTPAQLQALYEVGFRRLSVGIQDFDERVQFIINRPQTFAQTQQIFSAARAIGYTSINADIIYGLPLQTVDSVQKTIQYVKQLAPERIAFYSYAHVPWKSPAQRRYTEKDLPNAEEKRQLYEIGKEALLAMGYEEIGLDHFALPKDELLLALKEERLHRNFMGYTTRASSLLIGLGVSSISDSGTAFAQNVKEVEAYQAAIESGDFALLRGHLLSEEDLQLRQYILAIMCTGKANWQYETHPRFATITERLRPLAQDGLLTLQDTSLEVTPEGRLFLRNIALQFDQHYWQKRQSEQPVFSKAV